MALKTPLALYTEAQKLEQSGDVLGAIKTYKAFLSKHRTHPNATKVRIRAAQLCVMQGNHHDAIQLIKHSGGLGEKNLLMMFTLAQASAYAGQLEEARAALDMVLNIDPDYPPAIARLATIMQYEGLADKALDVIDNAYNRGIDAWDIDQTFGTLAHRAGRVDEAVDRIQRRLIDSNIKAAPRIELEFTLSALLEHQGNHVQAWESAARGNALKTADGMGGYSIKGSSKTDAKSSVNKDKARIEKTINIFSVEMLRSLQPDDTGPENRPEFLLISGMPRSGTTLLEQILSSHTNAESAGESPFVIQAAANAKMYPNPTEQIVRRFSTKKRTKIGREVLEQLQGLSGSNSYVVDKNPSNDEHLGFLAAIAPGAKMILTRRDPREIALSCYLRNFSRGHEWATNLESIVDTIETRFKLHEHWLKVIPEGAPWIGLRVGDYERIVSEPESQTREILEFAGLPWDDACLNFSNRKRIVPTLQPHQAAQGVYTGSLAKWVPYAECMGDQLDRLNSICQRYGFVV